MKAEISLSEARRIALTAQGFNAISRNKGVSASQIRKVIHQLGLLQIDSVNVLVRAQYVPVFHASAFTTVLRVYGATPSMRLNGYFGPV